MKPSRFLVTMLAGAACAMAIAAPALAATRDFNIPRGDLQTALDAYAQQSGLPVMYRVEDVRGKQSQGLHGALPTEEALSKVLRGTGFKMHRDQTGAIAIIRETTASSQVEAGDATSDDGVGSEIVVTAGTRIERAGFDQPTPTTVVGGRDLRQGARPDIQQVLNDLPQFRATTSPTTSITNQSTGTAPVDLRGLGVARTLTLLNGRRFVGENNLNFVPLGLVRQAEVVTGGASAAYGSGAVAGVVNIILNDKLEGLSVGTQSGISSRGDARRYGFDGSFGTSFAGGRGHFIVGAEYIKDSGITPDGRANRSYLSAGIVRVNPTSPTDQRTQLVPDLNYGNSALGGLITTGPLAGQIFNSDGSLRPFRGGTQVGAAAFNANQIGGADATSLYDNVYAASPIERLSSYARISYDIGGATIWADGTYGRVLSNYPWVPDLALTSVTVSAANPFLSQAIRNQLAGQTSFTLGRFFADAYTINLHSLRQNYEGAIGIDGSFGRFKYSAHYSHGEIVTDSRASGGRIVAKFNNALNAVAGPNGVPVCAINADAVTTNDDPGCVPVNPFGFGNVSAAARAYTTGTQTAHVVNKLDAAAAQIQGDLFSLPAGPVTAVVGGELRYESQSAQQGTVAIASTFSVPVFTSALSGGFNVKEGFAEVVVPVINANGRVKLDLNGAARYSDYSTSGGIWSWKVGGTLRLFDDLLVRATRSRDIRSPNVTELFSAQRVAFGSVVDAQSAKYSGTAGYNANPQPVTTVSGGNPNLVPEIGSTLTVGGSYTPSFLRGFSASVDYYDISIAGAILTLNASQLTQACGAGSAAACTAITRDATGTVTGVRANSQNLARFKTSGFDFEASYVLPLSAIGSSSLRLRGLATYVAHYIVDTGVTRIDSAGDVGDSVANAIPHWRGNLGLSFQGSKVALDARVRYIDGGKFNHLQDVTTSATGVTTGLINNKIASRTYLDLGAQFRVGERFTLTANVNNVFNRPPPLITSGSPIYDIVGTYFTLRAEVRF